MHVKSSSSWMMLLPPAMQVDGSVATEHCNTVALNEFACPAPLRDNRVPMAQRPNYLTTISELVVLLLGAMLMLLALTRTVGVPGTAVIVILGAILIYWALRAWMKKEPASARLQTHIRAGSLTVVGLLMITMPFSPLRYTNWFVALAGAVLVLRGLAAGILSLRNA